MIFHHEDREQVDAFVERFGHLFTAVGQRGVTSGDDFVSDPSDELIIRSIRDRYMSNAALAIVLVGKSTWSRRFVDWEIAAAIGTPQDEQLPIVVCDLDPRARMTIPLPPRLTLGWVAASSRLDVLQPPNTLSTAVGLALAKRSEDTPNAGVSQHPLLRRDLR